MHNINLLVNHFIAFKPTFLNILPSSSCNIFPQNDPFPAVISKPTGFILLWLSFKSGSVKIVLISFSILTKGARGMVLFIFEKRVKILS